MFFKSVLKQEQDNGGVFQNWLKRSHIQKMDKLIILLDFQYLIEEIEEVEDRQLNLCAAWKFFQKHFQINDSKHFENNSKNFERTKRNLTEGKCKIEIEFDDLCNSLL